MTYNNNKSHKKQGFFFSGANKREYSREELAMSEVKIAF